jgi:hypothetical protein
MRPGTRSQDEVAVSLHLEDVTTVWRPKIFVRAEDFAGAELTRDNWWSRRRNPSAIGIPDRSMARRVENGVAVAL